MHLQTRLEYESYLPAGDGSPPTERELLEHRATARAMHLCALGYMLAGFNPVQEIGPDWEDSIALRSYGLLIEQISEGIFNDIEALLELSKEN